MFVTNDYLIVFWLLVYNSPLYLSEVPALHARNKDWKYKRRRIEKKAKNSPKVLHNHCLWTKTVFSWAHRLVHLHRHTHIQACTLIYKPKHALTKGLLLMCLCNVKMLNWSLVSLLSSHISPIHRKAGKNTYTVVCHSDRKTNVRAWKSDRETHRQMTDDQTDSLNLGMEWNSQIFLCVLWASSRLH